MMTPNHILVGTDFDERGALTEGSANAARHALRLAEQCGAKVDFVHSTHRSGEDSTIHGDLNVGRAELAKLQAESAAVTSELVLDDRRPALALIQHVGSGSHDLVVVAKRNHRRRDDRKLGSVSMMLLRMCPCPVWVIKPEQEMAHNAIAAATDLSAVGDLAIQYGALLANYEPCKLFAVHAWQLPLELQMSHSRIGDEEFRKGTQQIIDAATRHIRAIPAFAELGERGKVLLANSTPSAAILELVEKQNPDLVVLGTVSRGGISGFLIGNTAEKLLYKLDCSLLAIKPDDFISPVS